MTDYIHPPTGANSTNWNLNNLHTAMQYNTSGEPVIRTLTSSKPADAGSTSAFGEIMTSIINPVFQLDGLYGLPERDFETYSNPASGSAGTTGTLMEVKSGLANNGYGVLRSRRAVRYRPGQGALTRFTAKFSTPQPGATQRAGFFTQEQALQVGYNGSDFGILRQNGGKAHIHRFEITGAVAGGGETLTLTLNDYSIAITLSGGASISQTAAEIAVGVRADFVGNLLWIVEEGEDHVSFLSTSVGPLGGLFEFSTTGAVTMTNSVRQAGLIHNDQWIYQSAFNIDTLDGNGPSGMDLDHQKLNVYQINFRWLGAGEMRFAIEDPNTGDLVFFHHLHYSNQNTDVHLDNPSLKVGYIAANLSGGPIAQEVSVCGASMMGAIEGLIRPTKFPSAAQTSNTTNIGANNLTHLISIKNRTLFLDKINTREFILKNLNAAFTQASATPVEVYIMFNFDPGFIREWTAVSETQSSVYYSNTQDVTTLGDNVPLYIIDVLESVSENLETLNLNIPPGSTISLLVESTAQITRSALSLSWLED